MSAKAIAIDLRRAAENMAREGRHGWAELARLAAGALTREEKGSGTRSRKLLVAEAQEELENRIAAELAAENANR